MATQTEAQNNSTAKDYARLDRLADKTVKNILGKLGVAFCAGIDCDRCPMCIHGYDGKRYTCVVNVAYALKEQQKARKAAQE